MRKAMSLFPKFPSWFMVLYKIQDILNQIILFTNSNHQT